jgi:hypothetical protein
VQAIAALLQPAAQPASTPEPAPAPAPARKPKRTRGPKAIAQAKLVKALDDAHAIKGGCLRPLAGGMHTRDHANIANSLGLDATAHDQARIHAALANRLLLVCAEADWSHVDAKMRLHKHASKPGAKHATRREFAEEFIAKARKRDQAWLEALNAKKAKRTQA